MTTTCLIKLGNQKICQQTNLWSVNSWTR